MIYNLIKQGQQKAINQACRVLQTSRSGYYAAKRRIEKPAICVASVQVSRFCGESTLLWQSPYR